MSRLQRAGWALFLLSAALFTAAAIRDGDFLVGSASVVFGVACVLFLIEDRL